MHCASRRLFPSILRTWAYSWPSSLKMSSRFSSESFLPGSFFLVFIVGVEGRGLFREFCEGRRRMRICAASSREKDAGEGRRNATRGRRERDSAKTTEERARFPLSLSNDDVPSSSAAAAALSRCSQSRPFPPASWGRLETFSLSEASLRSRIIPFAPLNAQRSPREARACPGSRANKRREELIDGGHATENRATMRLHSISPRLRFFPPLPLFFGMVAA